MSGPVPEQWRQVAVERAEPAVLGLWRYRCSCGSVGTAASHLIAAEDARDHQRHGPCWQVLTP